MHTPPLNPASSPDRPAARKRSPVGLIIVAALFVSMPLMTWQQTWFGRGLSESQTAEYLSDQKHPRHMQHALSQVSDRILHRDPAVSKWYPGVAALSQHPSSAIRATAAWVMGQDNRSDLFHRALLRLLDDRDLMVRRNAALALVRFSDPAGRAELLAMLRACDMRAPAAGRLTVGVRPGQKVAAGTLLARLAPAAGQPVEIRSLFAGEVSGIAAGTGAWVAPGAKLVSVDAGEDQVWEALRALYLIGRPEDLAEVERYTHRGLDISSQTREQAVLTARAIQARSEPGSTR